MCRFSKKSKKSILIIFLICFIFLPFSKSKEAKAFVVVDDIILWGGIAICAYFGYQLTFDNSDMAKDISESILEGFSDVVDFFKSESTWEMKFKEDIGVNNLASRIDPIIDRFKVPQTVATSLDTPFVLSHSFNTMGYISPTQDSVITVNGFSQNLTAGYKYKVYGSINQPSNLQWGWLNISCIELPGNTLANFEIGSILTFTSDKPLTITNQITIPYDGTQVTVLDTPVTEVKKDTVVTIPQTSVDKIVTGTLDGTQVTDKELGLDVTVPGVTGIEWLDTIIAKLGSLWDAIVGLPATIVDGIASLFIPSLSVSDISQALADKLNIPSITFPSGGTSKPLAIDFDISHVIPGFRIYRELDWPFFGTLRTWILGLEMIFVVLFYYRKIATLNGGSEE